MMTQTAENQELMSEINIVPFVDIVLVILIIFLILSPTFISPGFNIHLPKAETTDKPQNTRALITIDMDGIIYFNRYVIKKPDLQKKLKGFLQSDPNIKVVIAADKDVAHGNVISLIDFVRKAGVKKFAVSVKSNN